MSLKLYKHNTRRTFVAWLLLVLFTLPIVTKAVHVCQLHDLTTHGTAAAQSHHADKCAVCHFTFLSFDKAETVVLGSLIAILVYATFFFFESHYVSKRIALASLRAPPHTL